MQKGPGSTTPRKDWNRVVSFRARLGLGLVLVLVLVLVLGLVLAVSDWG